MRAKDVTTNLDELFTADALEVFADRNTDTLEYSDFTDAMRERAWLINGRFGQRCEANGVKAERIGNKFFATIK